MAGDAGRVHHDRGVPAPAGTTGTGGRRTRATVSLLAALAVLALPLPGIPAGAGDAAVRAFWDGPWFECEFAGRSSPPGDACSMLDDDGFLFSDGRVTYIKVLGSGEADGCKKQRPGQCFRADEDRISVSVNRTGRAEFTLDTLGIRFLGCTQIFHVTEMGAFLEARPDDKRCIWAGDKRFYLRRYEGEAVAVD